MFLEIRLGLLHIYGFFYVYLFLLLLQKCCIPKEFIIVIAVLIWASNGLTHHYVNIVVEQVFNFILKNWNWNNLKYFFLFLQLTCFHHRLYRFRFCLRIYIFLFCLGMLLLIHIFKTSTAQHILLNYISSYYIKKRKNTDRIIESNRYETALIWPTKKNASFSAR